MPSTGYGAGRETAMELPRLEAGQALVLTLAYQVAWPGLLSCPPWVLDMDVL